jgi:hypothetical protein
VSIESEVFESESEVFESDSSDWMRQALCGVVTAKAVKLASEFQDRFNAMTRKIINLSGFIADRSKDD